MGADRGGCCPDQDVAADGGLHSTSAHLVTFGRADCAHIVAFIRDACAMTAIKQQIRFCATDDGGRIAVATVGKGPPLLRAGHWLSHVELDARSPVWMHWLRELSRGHTYIRYDQRGCGLSDAAPASLSLEDWIGDLEAVANALGLRRFALFGMSHGGAVAIAYAARHPERVSHLVLLGTPVRGRFRRDAEQQEEGEVLLNLARIGWGRDNPAFRQVFTTLFMPDGTPEQHRSLNGLVRASTSPENAVAIHEALYQLDITALAKAVHVPTLVLHAHGDAIIPFEEGRHLATLIRSARFVPLDGRNHILHETEPAWAQFLTEVRAFLGDGADSAGVSEPPSGASRLTRSELQVLDLLARGHQNAVIADQLSKSEKTVRNQVSSILSKLGAHTRAEAVARARDAGIGTPCD
jgi:pimeloyl-ACP methyl ester carboxylesterase/DNA-binding CsgD family transcriptional regulator